MRLGIVAVIGLVVALAGCGQEDAIEVRTSGATPAATQDCGESVLQQGERISEQAADCFLDAVDAHSPASLEVSFPTTEGDLIQQTYESLETGKVEVTTDTTQDRYGSGEVQTQVCSGPVRSSFAFTFTTCA
ncbi:hypothetical protein [Kineosporia babensis]|uniref:Uncharacterized protein n=1 Tax=Kineosporia babensis TaxID=499548 RepID=A0A9X1NAB7_9ACTN|nr:hypothetical protein [Kineosporia babensis]MCD5310448.1 hypothetical protein [Kineosporia babensis]